MSKMYVDRNCMCKGRRMRWEYFAGSLFFLYLFTGCKVKMIFSKKRSQRKNMPKIKKVIIVFKLCFVEYIKVVVLIV